MKKHFTLTREAFFAILAAAVLLLQSCSLSDLFGSAGITSPLSTAEQSVPGSGTAALTDPIPDVSAEKIDYSKLSLDEYISLDYKGLPLESSVEKRVITDEILDAELSEIILYYDYYTLDTSRKTEAGDTIEMEYRGFIDGEQFSGGTSYKAKILLDTENSGYIQGFADGLIGVESGQEITLDLTFPENYYAELAGKPVTFKVIVHGICKAVLTDEIADKLSSGAQKDAASYRAYLKEYLEEMDDYRRFQDVYAKIWDALLEKAEIKKYPQQQLDYYLQSIKRSIAEGAAYYGKTISEYMLASGYTDEQIEKDVNEKVACELISQYILKSEGIEMNDGIYRDFLNEMVERYKAQGQEVSAEQIEQYFAMYYGEDYLQEQAVEEKVCHIVYGYADITYKPAE